MKTQFFHVKTREEVWAEYCRFPLLPCEEVPLDQADNRVLAAPVLAAEDLPSFPRSTVDGYAVRARDTFGASESLPSLLQLVGEVLMGQEAGIELGAGQTVRIPTGGMLPRNADAVVMVEYTEELDSRSVAVGRSVAPLENVIQPGDDCEAGAEVLPTARRLRPQDIGLLAGIGHVSVSVRRRPRVAIISTGDEIVPLEETPLPGQIRDINLHSLAAMVRHAGGEPVLVGLVADQYEPLRRSCEQALAQADICLISGGSSVGTRDLTLEVLSSFADSEVLVHGVAISPGKPTILLRIGSKAFWGLPGHVTSALVVFQVLVRPFIDYLAGMEPALGRGWPLAARLSRNVPSKQGREDFVRVRLTRKAGVLEAEPLFGPSGLISPLVKADGLVRIERYSEGIYGGAEVEVWLL
ncbi:MAG: molybdopterin molybdotransferase MoeA [Deltaproteobacteria bacterium]|nr:molybdopterin molybdotransferase MoeA [Deltaproteobacteria bacterium]